MKSNKLISNILLFLIGISFVYVIVKIFKIKFVEGFDTIPSLLNPTIDVSTNIVSPLNNIQNNTIEPPLNNMNSPLNNMNSPLNNMNNNFPVQTIYENNRPESTWMKDPIQLEIYNKLEDISDNLFSDYDASQNFYNSSGNMIPQILSKLNDLTLKLDRTNNLKCVANFGTKIGEPLSNGIGVLSDTNYICPEELPNCAGMLCDKKYGVCTK